MNVMYYAMQNIGNMDWSSITKGLVGMGGALAEISVSLNVLPKNMPTLAFGLIEGGTALYIIADAMKTMESLSWDGLIKS